MGLFNAGSGTGGVQARAQRLEMLIGIVGFFTLMALIQTIVLEVRGKDAAGAAVLLAVLVAITWFVVRLRRNLPVPLPRLKGGPPKRS
jgi:hypothetical protein